MSGQQATKRTMVENGRADYAFRAVQKRSKGPGAGNYKSYVKKLPSLIQVNGLGQTLAFCMQKKKEYKEIYDDLCGWISQTHPELVSTDGIFVQQIIQLDSKNYRDVTREILALLNWMRKFADGMIEKENGD